MQPDLTAQFSRRSLWSRVTNASSPLDYRRHFVVDPASSLDVNQRVFSNRPLYVLNPQNYRAKPSFST